MSYSEYLDMFIECQKKECPYRAFTFDIVNSKSQKIYKKDAKNLYRCVLFVYLLLEREEQKTGKQILLKDKFNRKLINDESRINNNDYNPILRGKKSSKLIKAENLKLNGNDIEIMSENVFYDIIDEYKEEYSRE